MKRELARQHSRIGADSIFHEKSWIMLILLVRTKNAISDDKRQVCLMEGTEP